MNLPDLPEGSVGREQELAAFSSFRLVSTRLMKAFEAFIVREEQYILEASYLPSDPNGDGPISAVTGFMHPAMGTEPTLVIAVFTDRKNAPEGRPPVNYEISASTILIESGRVPVANISRLLFGDDRLVGKGETDSSDDSCVWKISATLQSLEEACERLEEDQKQRRIKESETKF